MILTLPRRMEIMRAKINTAPVMIVWTFEEMPTALSF
jgi:hypothetical protein